MTAATRKKILTTHNACWFTAVLITCLLVFIPDNGNFLILIPVMIASCGFVSLLSINKTLSNDGSPDRQRECRRVIAEFAAAAIRRMQPKRHTAEQATAG